MAQQLKAYTALAEDPSLVPSTHVRQSCSEFRLQEIQPVKDTLGIYVVEVSNPVYRIILVLYINIIF